MGLREYLLKEKPSMEALDRDIVKEMTDNGFPIIVWGTGIHGRIITDVIEKYGGHVFGYCVGQAYWRPEMKYKGKIVYPLDALNEKCNLVLAANEIWHELKEISRKDFVKIYSFERYCQLCEMDFEWVEQNIEKLNMTYRLFDDEISKKTFMAYINAKCGAFLGREGGTPLWRLMVSEQYFNDLYDPRSYEKNVLLDVGAYTGDTAKRFIEYVDDEKAVVYAFEPEEKNFGSLAQLAEDLTNIKCYNYGLSDCKGTTFITSSGSTSTLIDDGEGKPIELIKGDDLLVNKYISMIKMDVEGSEISALQGLKNTIMRDMPFLAISVYHKTDDLITIPSFIRKIESGQDCYRYKYYLRNHTPIAAETVFYAVPEKM